MPQISRVLVSVPLTSRVLASVNRILRLLVSPPPNSRLLDSVAPTSRLLASVPQISRVLVSVPLSSRLLASLPSKPQLPATRPMSSLPPGTRCKPRSAVSESNPHFPALWSDPMVVSKTSRRKQIPSSTVSRNASQLPLDVSLERPLQTEATVEKVRQQIVSG